MTVQEQLIFSWAVDFVTDQAGGEWDDEMIRSDATKMMNQILDRLPQWNSVAGI